MRLKILLRNDRGSTESFYRDGCSPVNLPQNFRTPFYNNTFGGLLLGFVQLDLFYETFVILISVSFHPMPSSGNYKNIFFL